MEISTPSSSFKCPTCKLFFVTEDEHKQHYKSDFHRYNLKRSMVNLPPATLQQFSTKRLETKNQKPSSFECRQCRKTFASAQTLNQHAISKKHDINMVRQEKPEKMIEQRPKVYKKNDKLCLFCAKQSQSLESSLVHMRIEHSFFIAQEEYCIDRSKLILYLQQKIQVGMMCILCDNKGAKDFSTGEAVRNHMLSKNHTFMNTEKGFEEYEDFYDFSALFNEKLQEQKSYPSPLGINFQKVKVIVDEQKQKKNKQSKAARNEEMKDENDEDEEDWDDADSDEENEEWEDESEDSDTAIQQENEQENQNEQEIKEKTKRKVKTYQIMVPTLTSTEELLLPNGKTLGHRKYRHIYRQALKINNWFQNNKMMIEEGANQHALVLRNNLLQLIKKERVMKRFNRREDKRYVKEGIQNSNLFRHFRSSNPL